MTMSGSCMWMYYPHPIVYPFTHIPISYTAPTAPEDLLQGADDNLEYRTQSKEGEQRCS